MLGQSVPDLDLIAVIGWPHRCPHVLRWQAEDSQGTHFAELVSAGRQRR